MFLLRLVLSRLHWLSVSTLSQLGWMSYILLLIYLTSCQHSTSPDSILADPDSVQDLSYAQGFAINYHQNTRVLELFSTYDTLRYLLQSNEEEPPSGVIYDQVIRTPVQRIVTQSTTHLAFLKMLNSADAVVGLDNASYVCDSTFIQQVDSGQIQEVGSGNSLNTEKALALLPDLILVSHMPGNGLSAYQKFIELGIPVLSVAEWTEGTPLGKVEWLKLFAALLDKEALAQTKFARTEEAYTSLAQITQAIAEKPEVIVGSPFQDSWYVPGANSYRNALLQDAGATWAYSQDSTAVSFPVAFERMYDLGLKADIWLDPGQTLSAKEIQGIDPRFADFSAFQSGKIYNSNRRLNALGSGNDYYESGVVYPQRILADLIKILHPELVPHHQLYYYQQLP